MKPRCGRVMHAYEAVWGALLDDVTCGRPEGHNGSCRSVQAVRKSLERGRKNWAEDQERSRQLREQYIRELRDKQVRKQLLALAEARKVRDEQVRRELFAAVEAAAKQAEDREMAKRAVNW